MLKKDTSKPFVNVSDMSLTEKQKEAIDMYTSGESLWINNYLRDRNMTSLNTAQKNKMKLYSKHINDLINISPLSKKNTTVYRGAEAMFENWKELKLGSELLFTEKGIISTSFSRKVALDFIEEDDNCCLLVLRLPKGTKGLYLNTLSAFRDLEEDELLLPHGSKFVVSSRRTNVFDGKSILTYYAVLISQ